MKNTCCSCLCGNIQIRGNLCEQNKFHNFKQVEQQQKSKKKALFSFQPHTIEIHITVKEKASNFCNTCSDMRCLNCGTIFHFLSIKGNPYFERIQFPIKFPSQMILIPKKNHENISLDHCLQNSSKNRTENSFNEINHDFCSLNSNIINQNYDADGDFEIMFSNKFDPFVGSYETKLDESIFSKNNLYIKPNSYYQ
ncbi:hypothetical protein M9Y10_030889 [Tritrichomonas musculus]|uniref:Uncharacterized protein n=1 Tax=Tritrichomonas musculus TaxID=1915356 RepID=A0ABR2H423_9EUKA